MLNDTVFERMMGQRAFIDLNNLCTGRPEMFAPSSSPPGPQLTAFFETFMQTDYVRGLLEFGELRSAITALERGYVPNSANLKSRPISDKEQAVLRSQKRKERQMRFIHRLASLFGPWSIHPHVFSERVQRRKRVEAAKWLEKSYTALHAVLHDEYFNESVAPVSKLEVLLRLRDELRDAARWIKEAKPLYPTQRLRDDGNNLTRQMVNRVADACFRIYGHCNKTIMLNLAGSSWLDFLSCDLNIDRMITLALERKVDQFERRVPNEDYPHASLTGEWSPSTSASPPWMNA